MGQEGGPGGANTLSVLMLKYALVCGKLVAGENVLEVQRLNHHFGRQKFHLCINFVS